MRRAGALALQRSFRCGPDRGANWLDIAPQFWPEGSQGAARIGMIVDVGSRAGQSPGVTSKPVLAYERTKYSVMPGSDPASNGVETAVQVTILLRY